MADRAGAGARAGARGPEAAGPGRRAAGLLAFACFFATLPVYSPNIVALNPAEVPEVTAWFAQGVLLFTVAAAVVAAARSAFGRPAREPGGAAPLALYFAGGAVYSLLVGLGSAASAAAADALGLLCALLAAAGIVPACVRWAAVYAEAGLARLLGVCGLGSALAAVANMAVAALPQPASLALHVCMLAAGSFAPLALARPAGRRGAAEGAPGAAQAPSRAERARSFMSVMGMPLLGIALSSFVIGIAPTRVFGDAVDTQTVGAIAAASVLGLTLLAAWRRGVPTSALVQRMLVPLAAACALAACAFPGMSGDGRTLACYTLFALVGVVALAMGSGISNAGEFPRPFVFATLVGTYCLTALLGLAAGAATGQAAEHHADVVVGLACAYGLLAVGVACAHAVSPGAEVTDEGVLGTAVPAARPLPGPDASLPGAAVAPGAPAGQAAAAALDVRADLLARSFGLTPREEEIVRILARGHGCGFVADTLLISKSTVYTHVRNIYRKLDVSNHDQLIQLLDQQVA